MTSGIVCPYCDHEHDPTELPSDRGKQVCEHCEAKFWVDKFIEYRSKQCEPHGGCGGGGDQ